MFDHFTAMKSSVTAAISALSDKKKTMLKFDATDEEKNAYYDAILAELIKTKHKKYNSPKWWDIDVVKNLVPMIVAQYQKANGLGEF